MSINGYLTQNNQQYKLNNNRMITFAKKHNHQVMTTNINHAMSSNINNSVMQNGQFYRAHPKAGIKNAKNVSYKIVGQPISSYDHRRFINASDRYIDSGYSSYNNQLETKKSINKQNVTEKTLHNNKTFTETRPFNENFVNKKDGQASSKYSNYITLPKNMDVKSMKAINNPQNFVFLKDLLIKNNENDKKQIMTQQPKRITKSCNDKKRKFKSLQSQNKRGREEILNKINQSVGFQVTKQVPSVSKLL